jgi:hypothetical protein
MESRESDVQNDHSSAIPNPDLLLLALVAVVDSVQGDMSFSVTLMVDGGIVFGELISSRVYFSEVSRLLAEVENGESLSLIFELANERIDKVSERVHCLHLKNAVVRQGVPMGDVEFPLLRIRLSAVGGFSIGRVSV